MAGDQEGSVVFGFTAKLFSALLLTSLLGFLAAAPPVSLAQEDPGVEDAPAAPVTSTSGPTVAEVVASAAGVPFREVSGDLWRQLSALPSEALLGPGEQLSPAAARIEAAAAAASVPFFSAAYEGLEDEVAECRSSGRPGCLADLSAELAIAAGLLLEESDESVFSLNALKEDTFEVFASTQEAEDFAEDFARRLRAAVVTRLEVAASSESRPQVRSRAQEVLSALTGPPSPSVPDEEG